MSFAPRSTDSTADPNGTDGINGTACTAGTGDAAGTAGTDGTAGTAGTDCTDGTAGHWLSLTALLALTALTALTALEAQLCWHWRHSGTAALLTDTGGTDGTDSSAARCCWHCFQLMMLFTTLMVLLTSKWRWRSLLQDTGGFFVAVSEKVAATPNLQDPTTSHQVRAAPATAVLVHGKPLPGAYLWYSYPILSLLSVTLWASVVIEYSRGRLCCC